MFLSNYLSQVFSKFQWFFLVYALSSSAYVWGQNAAPVTFKGDTLYLIQTNIGTFSSQQRAEMVQKNIQQLAKLPLTEFDSVQVLAVESGANIIYKEQIIATITNNEADLQQTTALNLAQQRWAVIRQALIDDFNDNSFSELAKDTGLFLLAVIVFLIVFRLVNMLFDYFRRNLKQLQHNVFFQDNPLVRFFAVITPETERNMLLFILRMFRFTVLGIFLYFYLPFMFSQISYTRGLGETILGYLLSPLAFLVNSFVSYLPKLLFIIIILVAMNYLLRALSYIAQQIKTERITIDGFFPDWAVPTFNLFKALIVVFTLVIIFPYLPGAGSDAFQGISVFIGLLLSLGAADAIKNVISGVILTYMRPFQVGDRVNINGKTGDIMSKNLLVTRLKTTKNEEITIPNASLLGGGVINYTTQTKNEGIILNTSITIGYDAPWQQVHQLLLDAANKTANIEQEPKPFVLQTSLNDWYVAYELNAYTKNSHLMPKTYSELHANIQDVFNEAGLEIMSSHYMAVRDGNAKAVPEAYLKGSSE